MARTYGSGEAVNLNFGPLMTAAVNEQRMEAAQNAALAQAIQADMKNVKPDGIRTQDTEAYTKAYDDWKNAAIQYKLTSSATKNPLDRANAWNEYQDKLQSIKNVVNESKNAKLQEGAWQKFYSTNHDKIDLNSFASGYNGVKSPIGTPEYEQAKGKDITSVLFNPASFDGKKWNGLFSDLTPKLVKTSKSLPTGQVENTMKYMIDPEAVANRASQYYQGNLLNSKKYFDTLYQNTSPEEIQSLESFAKKYIPDFKINDPEDFAVASSLYNKGIELDAGKTITGSPYVYNNAQANTRQQNAFAHSDEQLRIREANKDARTADKDHFIVNDIAAAVRAGDTKSAMNPLRAAAMPGAQVGFIQNGLGNDGGRLKMINLLKKFGIDGQSKNPSQSDLDAGLYIVSVPVINPKTKKVMPGQYKLMTISGADPNPAYRANQALQFISGNPKGKTLSNKFKEVLPSTIQEEEQVQEDEDEELNDDENFDQ